MKSKAILAVAIIIIFGGILLFANENVVTPIAQNTNGKIKIGVEQRPSTIITVLDENNEKVQFDTSNWKVYENKEFNFSVKYPEKYEVSIPNIDRSNEDNKNTLFLFSIRMPGAANDIGHAFSIDSTWSQVSRDTILDIQENSQDYLVRKITIQNGAKEEEVLYSLKLPTSKISLSFFTMNDLHTSSLSAGYSFPEHQAILSTLEF